LTLNTRLAAILRLASGAMMTGHLPPSCKRQTSHVNRAVSAMQGYRMTQNATHTSIVQGTKFLAAAAAT
jgi:hypothetical protein